MSTGSALCVKSFVQALGPGAVIEDPCQLADYVVDGWRPALVLTPSTPEEAGAALEAAASQGLAVVPWGAGTKMGLGPAPERAGVVVCTGGMAGITDYDPENLTVTVRAGTTLSSLQEAVRRDGLRVPLDPPHARQATVGGILAANSSGPRRFLHGAPRDLALGLRAALAGGSVIRAGGKTVKNVAGYDLTKLFVGSLGTLGVIAEATLRLRPVAEEERTLVIHCRGLDEAGELARQILAAPDLLPAALELLDGRAVELLAERTAQALGPGPALVVALEGFAEEVAGQARRLAALGPAVALEDSVAVWSLLTNWVSDGAVARAGVPARELVHFMGVAARAAISLGLVCPAIAEAATGIVRLYPSPGPVDSPALIKWLLETRTAACGMGGYMVLEKASSEVKASVGVWGDPGRAFTAMEGLKSVFDPRGVLNPGRFVGGI